MLDANRVIEFHCSTGSALAGLKLAEHSLDELMRGLSDRAGAGVVFVAYWPAPQRVEFGCPSATRFAGEITAGLPGNPPGCRQPRWRC